MLLNYIISNNKAIFIITIIIKIHD